MITKSHGGSRLTVPSGDGADDGDIAKNALLFTKKVQFIYNSHTFLRTQGIYITCKSNDLNQIRNGTILIYQYSRGMDGTLSVIHI